MLRLSKSAKTVWSDDMVRNLRKTFDSRRVPALSQSWGGSVRFVAGRAAVKKKKTRFL
jgi:hypothetical protein